MKLCKQCGKGFEPNKPKQIFCSDKCRVYYNRSIKKGIPKLPSVNLLKDPSVEVLVKAPHIKGEIQPLTKENHIEEPPTHELWKKGDPSEGSNAFFLKYGAFYYDDIKT